MALLRRGWICFEIAVRMISDKPMVELIDPHRKASELYQSGGLQLDFFSGMETFKDEDKLLIQDAIRKLFTRGDSYLDGADPELNFNRGVGDFVHLTGGKMRVGDLFVRAEQGESDCFQVIHELFAPGAQVPRVRLVRALICVCLDVSMCVCVIVFICILSLVCCTCCLFLCVLSLRFVANEWQMARVCAQAALICVVFRALSAPGTQLTLCVCLITADSGLELDTVC